MSHQRSGFDDDISNSIFGVLSIVTDLKILFVVDANFFVILVAFGTRYMSYKENPDMTTLDLLHKTTT